MCVVLSIILIAVISVLYDMLMFFFSCFHIVRFSPEVLGLCASTALVWIIIEVLAMLLSLYLLTVHTDLSTFDLIAYSGYKYVGYVP